MSDTEAMVVWLRGVLDDEEWWALNAGGRQWVWQPGATEIVAPNATDDGLAVRINAGTSKLRRHIARHDPPHVLAVVAAHRAIIDEVMSWRHFYLDEDAYYSCAQAVGPYEPDAEPGSGCIDGDRAGKPCDCGLDRRRRAILGPLAAGYASRHGHREEWR